MPAGHRTTLSGEDRDSTRIISFTAERTIEMKKTILSLGIVLAMSVALCACGGGSSSGSGGQTVNPPPDKPQQPAPGADIPPPSERKQ